MSRAGDRPDDLPSDLPVDLPSDIPVEIPVEIPEDIALDGPETVAEQRLMASLGRQARGVNLARVVRLIELLDAHDGGGLDDAGRREAENLAHQVVGSAGTFGFPAASVDAVAIEEYFAARPAGSGPGADAGLVRRTLVRLRSQFTA